MRLKKITSGLVNLSARWVQEKDAVAAVESALIFPLLLVMLLGTFDMGNGILANQKAIRASQVVADLVTRTRTLPTSELSEAVDAGELAFAPLASSSYGVDVVSISFDNSSNAQIVWRETRNMTALADVLDRVEPLAAPNSGVVVVTVEYDFEPIFAGFIVDEIPMQETAFARGRESAVVTLE